MMRPPPPRGGLHRARIVACALALAFAGDALADASGLAAFSATLDAQWNFGKPAESEQRFRVELARWPAGDPQALVVLTQIARTQGLRRDFDAAHATLDTVAGALPTAPSHLRIRYLLERGRVFNSAGTPAQSVPLFAEALALAECNGDEFYAVDAAHMLGIAAPAAERLDWNLKALALAEAATDPRAARWRGSLYNNIGWTYHERGDAATALGYFAKAQQEYARSGSATELRVARWTVARAQRTLGRHAEAKATQLALAKQQESAGETDGYVYEELALLAVAENDAAGARTWAAKARPLLAADPWFVANEKARLARMAELAGDGR
jgi:tetratricopeptide (TPR) repeat protein